MMKCEVKIILKTGPILIAAAGFRASLVIQDTLSRTGASPHAREPDMGCCFLQCTSTLVSPLRNQADETTKNKSDQDGKSKLCVYLFFMVRVFAIQALREPPGISRPMVTHVR